MPYNYEPGAEAIYVQDTTPFATERANKTGFYDTDVIQNIIDSALRYNINPYYTLGLAMKESNLGNAGGRGFLGVEANPFHVNEIYWPEVQSMPGNPQDNFIDYAVKNLVKPGYDKYSDTMKQAQHFHRPNVSKWNDFTREQAGKVVGYKNMFPQNEQINALVNSRIKQKKANTLLNSFIQTLIGE